MEFAYKKNMDEVVARHEKLWTKNFTNKILVKIDIEGLDTKDFSLNMIQYAPDYKKMFQCYQDFFFKKKDLLDDSIPVARASFGSGAISHFFGGETEWTTGGAAYVKPFIEDLKSFDFSLLEYDPEKEWIKKQLAMVDYFARNAEFLFPVCITEVIMGLLFVEYLLGTDMYYELYDHPELVIKLLEKSVEFNMRFIDEQRKLIKKYKGGVFEMFDVWLPGNQIWNSVDNYINCGPKLYGELGKLHYEMIGEYYGGIWMHMHSNALKLVKEIANTKYITGINIMDDINFPRGFEVIDKLVEDANGIPLQVFCTKDELLEGIKNKSLKRNVYYWCNHEVKTVEEANKIMEMVYEY